MVVPTRGTKQVNQLEWGAPNFIQSKKNGTVRFLSNFRKVNKRIRRKPFSIPKIEYMLIKLEGFIWNSIWDTII